MGSQAPQRPTPEQSRAHCERPVSPPPPPPPFAPVTVTLGPCKGGQNPDNTSDARPAPPQGSNGQSFRQKARFIPEADGGSEQLPSNVATDEQIEQREPSVKQVRLVEISNAMLREILHLPDGAIIESCHADYRNIEPSIVLRVRHSDFSPVSAGLSVPYVTPQYRSSDDGRVEFLAWDRSEVI